MAEDLRTELVIDALDSYDNAVTESFFFSTLECESLDRSRFATRTQARTTVFDYLEGFYNPCRRHPPSASSAPSTTSGATSLHMLPSPDPSTNRGNSTRPCGDISI